MIVAIHQPNYLPYLGFFRKMLQADAFILYDTAQFSKNEFQNRNRIKGARGVQWLTVPVRRSGAVPVREVEIANERRWASTHLRTIEAAYRRAPYYATYAPELDALLSRPWGRLADLNAELVRTMARWFAIDRKILRASDLPAPPTKDPTEKILHLTQAVGGDAYLSGPGGRAYLDTAKFRPIGLAYSDFVARPYPQLHGPFVPNLSSVDALLNCGEAARDLLA